MMTAATSKNLRLAGRFVAPVLWLIGLGIIIAQWTGGSGDTIATSFSAGLVAIGSLFGLIATYMILSQFLLQSRLPILEAPFGRANLVHVHRINGYAIIFAIYFHASFLIIGYALANHVSVARQDLNFIQQYPYVLWSSIALVLFTAIVGVSITIVRRHLKYETWYYVHLLTYLAILLAFKHQLIVGLDFIGPNAHFFRTYWWGLYIFTLAAVVIYRFGRPAYHLLRYNFKVDRVVPEAAGINSIYVTGRGLSKLNYQPGQFMIWRFLDSTRFWQSHPFTISQAPDGKSLRLTFKAVGDFTRTLSQVKPGTPVLIDGPYGDFTLQDETNNKLLFIAGGIGLTPLRSMIERLPAGTSGVLVYAARTAADIALKDELTELTKSRNVAIKYLLSDETKAGYEHGVVDGATLRRLVPDYKARTVYLCGPPPMIKGVTAMLLSEGLPNDRIKSERFAF